MESIQTISTRSKPSSVAYTIQRAPLSKPPIGLRLIFTMENRQYVFLDFAIGDALKQTRIPVQINDYGEAFINEETIKNSLRSQLNRKDLQIHPLEVLGY